MSYNIALGGNLMNYTHLCQDKDKTSPILRNTAFSNHSSELFRLVGATFCSALIDLLTQVAGTLLLEKVKLVSFLSAIIISVSVSLL